MRSLTSTNARGVRIAAIGAATAVIGGLLGLAAPSAGATSTSGMVTAWGSASSAGATSVPAGALSGVQAIAAGSATAYALKNGSVSGWGYNGNGEANIPVAAQSGVAAIDAEHSTAMALKTDGSIVTWGWGGSAAIPTGLTGVTQVAATDDGGLALLSDHTIRSWGLNWGNPTSFPVPAAVQGHAVAIDGGFQFSVALTDTGSVVTWGEPLSLAPWRTVPDAAKSGVVKIAASDERIAAVKSDGSVVTWGSNNIGAVPAAAMSNVVDVTVGTDSVFAQKSDGSLVSWGIDYGQLTIPAAATYQVSDVAAGYGWAMTLHQPMSAPTITGTPTPGVLGQPYDYAMTVGGAPAPTMQVTAGTLPAGLSMDNTGHITGTPTKAGRTTVTVTAQSLAGSTNMPVTITVQPGHSTNLQFIDPPASVATGALESDQYARSFAERYNQTLTSNLTVGGTTVPAGTKVNVYYLHADHVGSDNVAHTLAGSEWFGSKILATATTAADLQATTAQFGAPGTTYATGTDQGLEFDDTVTKYVDQTGINYALNSWTASDAVRIITLAP
jgi:hypothetical protein